MIPARIYDVTRPLAPGCVVYPGDIVPEFREEDHGKYRITGLILSSHSGTHIDAPSHFLESGRAVDELPFSALMGWCRVIDCSGAGNEITAADIGGKIRGTDKILLKTAFSGKHRFSEEYPALSAEASRVLAGEGITCIGTDAPSIEGYRSGGEVHRTLLSAGMVIIELLDLSEVRSGEYWMIALPLRLRGCDGSPCRVLLLDGCDHDGTPCGGRT
ncbi:MAG: cyclase family protein [Methanomicrobiales archaeon]|nr:cyclase family protein [Methanomicrobiales archaeon]NYT20990.1 cyclase family protein [Methanomicrobiales archaeon]